MTDDKKYMERAIRLAEKGAGWVNPNPLVGAVIVRDGRIIGEGFHAHFGGPHAEAEAIAGCTGDPAGATLYVTLEPCAHQGKTPPCADLIAGKKIARVVIGMVDPNAMVNGKGIGKLRNAGISVETGVLEEQVRRQNEVFIKYITTNEPFVVLKTAMTLDGKTATSTKESRWISGDASRRLVHRMRHRYSAILAGAGTVISDDPLLNVRTRSKNVRQPLKVIVDSSFRVPLEANVFRNDPQLTLVAVTERAPKEKCRSAERLGAQVVVCPDRKGRVDLSYLMKALGSMEIDSLMIEGGGTIAFSALEAGIVDKVVTFAAPMIVGGKEAPSPVGGEGIPRLADAVRLSEINVKKIGDDFLIEGRIKR